MSKESEELEGQITWFECLRDSIEAGDVVEAIEGINAAIKLLKKQREK